MVRMYIMCIYTVHIYSFFKKRQVFLGLVCDVSSMCSRFRTFSNVSIFCFGGCYVCMVWYGNGYGYGHGYDMLQYVMLCYVMICYAILCFYVMYIYIYTLSYQNPKKFGSMSLSKISMVSITLAPRCTPWAASRPLLVTWSQRFHSLMFRQNFCGFSPAKNRQLIHQFDLPGN